ncbi:MAG: hypothetical protein GX294_07010 [Candidatus Cloacimonetes bacterium]|nr:hypothetical protein [Candidatus Cloacimonadota bacterium]
MNEINYISMNKKLYDGVIGYISELTSQRFRYLNLADDIANCILAKLIKSPAYPKIYPKKSSDCCYPQRTQSTTYMLG